MPPAHPACLPAHHPPFFSLSWLTLHDDNIVLLHARGCSGTAASMARFLAACHAAFNMDAASVAAALAGLPRVGGGGRDAPPSYLAPAGSPLRGTGGSGGCGPRAGPHCGPSQERYGAYLTSVLHAPALPACAASPARVLRTIVFSSLTPALATAAADAGDGSAWFGDDDAAPFVVVFQRGRRVWAGFSQEKARVMKGVGTVGGRPDRWAGGFLPQNPHPSPTHTHASYLFLTLQDGMIPFSVDVPVSGDVCVAIWFGGANLGERLHARPALAYAFHTAFAPAGALRVTAADLDVLAPGLQGAAAGSGAATSLRAAFVDITLGDDGAAGPAVDAAVDCGSVQWMRDKWREAVSRLYGPEGVERRWARARAPHRTPSMDAVVGELGARLAARAGSATADDTASDAGSMAATGPGTAAGSGPPSEADSPTSRLAGRRLFPVDDDEVVVSKAELEALRARASGTGGGKRDGSDGAPADVARLREAVAALEAAVGEQARLRQAAEERAAAASAAAAAAAERPPPSTPTPDVAELGAMLAAARAELAALRALGAPTPDPAQLVSLRLVLDAARADVESARNAKPGGAGEAATARLAQAASLRQELDAVQDAVAAARSARLSGGEGDGGEGGTAAKARAGSRLGRRPSLDGEDDVTSPGTVGDAPPAQSKAPSKPPLPPPPPRAGGVVPAASAKSPGPRRPTPPPPPPRSSAPPGPVRLRPFFWEKAPKSPGSIWEGVSAPDLAADQRRALEALFAQAASTISPAPRASVKASGERGEAGGLGEGEREWARRAGGCAGSLPAGGHMGACPPSPTRPPALHPPRPTPPHSPRPPFLLSSRQKAARCRHPDPAVPRQQRVHHADPVWRVWRRR